MDDRQLRRRKWQEGAAGCPVCPRGDVGDDGKATDNDDKPRSLEKRIDSILESQVPVLPA